MDLSCSFKYLITFKAATRLFTSYCMDGSINSKLIELFGSVLNDSIDRR